MLGRPAGFHKTFQAWFGLNFANFVFYTILMFVFGGKKDREVGKAGKYPLFYIQEREIFSTAPKQRFVGDISVIGLEDM